MTYALAKLPANAAAAFAHTHDAASLAFALSPPTPRSSSSSPSTHKAAAAKARSDSSSSKGAAAMSRSEFTRRLVAGEVAASSEVFNLATEQNRVELLVDGRDTYKRMHDVMMAAQHSIRILAWEMSFQIVLAPLDRPAPPMTPSTATLKTPSPSSPLPPPPPAVGVTLEVPCHAVVYVDDDRAESAALLGRVAGQGA